MPRPSLLVCLPAAPFPARRNGIAVRYAPVLAAFSEHYDIDVIQLVNQWAGGMAPGTDAGVLRRYDSISLSREASSLAGRLYMRARTLAYPRPPHATFSLGRQQVAMELKNLLANRHYDCGLWVHSGLADLAVPILRNHCDRIVFDAIDSWTSLALKTSNGSALARWDLYWLRRWEQRICRLFDAASYISKSDIALLTSDDPELGNEITHLPNGVLHDDYVEEVAEIDGISRDDFVIGFLGHMAYSPNIQAALRLSRIYQALRPEVPNAKLLIIGRSPAKPIRALADLPGVVVTGTVDTIWPFINRTNVFVVPLTNRCIVRVVES